VQVHPIFVVVRLSSNDLRMQMRELKESLRVLLVCVLFAVVSGVASGQSTRAVPAALLSRVLASPEQAETAGNSQGDVTVVEYFDYDCPVCRHLEPQLRQLLETDPNVRLIRKDWPVFGDASEYAALCTYAAAREGRYPAAHDALILTHQDLESKQDVQNVLRKAGFNTQRLDADIQAHAKEYRDALARARGETSDLGLQGTPGLIVGRQLVLGGTDLPELQKLVQRARNSRGSVNEARN